jgi:hypothetical protein
MASNYIYEINFIGVLMEIFDITQKAKENVKGKAKYHFNALLNTDPNEPKVSKILAGFLKGQSWHYYKFVSYEEAYSLQQELVR